MAQILKKGVGMSTLPCVKLRAIVEAAREISRLYEREHGDGQILGADDFLPIFIFSVVRAEMERPCALCKFDCCRRGELHDFFVSHLLFDQKVFCCKHFATEAIALVKLDTFKPRSRQQFLTYRRLILRRTRTSL